jgi:prolyl 4-hydroxylase
MTSSDIVTIGERIERIIMEMESLYKATGLEYFRSHASGWSQWVWMLRDDLRKEWQLTYCGDVLGRLKNELLSNVDAFVVKDVLTPNECTEWIQRAEQEGFQRPSITGDMFAGKRKRVIIKSEELAARVWDKINTIIPARVHDEKASASFSFSGPANNIRSGGYFATHINPLFRFSKYDQGDEFAIHTDTCYARDEHETGLCTILLYLNGCDDMQGGETVIFPNRGCDEKINITPEPGLALVFYHMLPHAGLEVTSGCKYVIRSDVMYRRVSDIPI